MKLDRLFLSLEGKLYGFRATSVEEAKTNLLWCFKDSLGVLIENWPLQRADDYYKMLKEIDAAFVSGIPPQHGICGRYASENLN